MVYTIEVLGEIIGKFLLAWVPLHIKLSHLNLIGHPNESHFHRSSALFLDSAICYSSGCEVITMYWWWWLWVAHFFS